MFFFSMIEYQKLHAESESNHFLFLFVLIFHLGNENATRFPMIYLSAASVPKDDDDDAIHIVNIHPPPHHHHFPLLYPHCPITF